MVADPSEPFQVRVRFGPIQAARPALRTRPRGERSMYEAYFGLRRRPFRSTPDSDAYYPATAHEQAAERLLRAVREDEGLALLTGPPGTGKTLVCHALLERLGPEVSSAFLTNSHVGDRRALLQSILFDLSLPYEGKTEQELRLA